MQQSFLSLTLLALLLIADMGQAAAPCEGVRRGYWAGDFQRLN